MIRLVCYAPGGKGSEHPAQWWAPAPLNTIVNKLELRAGGAFNTEMPFTAIITLEDHPDGMKYTATALHQNDENRKKHADMGFVDGWGMCIEQLGKLAEQLA